MSSAAVAIAALLAVLIAPASAHVGNHEVLVFNNYFEPAKLHVDPGETVTWRRMEGAHTVTADDGSFATTGSSWDTFAAVMPNEDMRVNYRCEIHAAMRGAIIVGDPPPPDPNERVLEVRRVPSADHPTVTSALTEPSAAMLIELEPGIYREALTVPAASFPEDEDPEVIIRGVGATPSDVVLDGEGLGPDTGLYTDLDGVSVENLTVRNYRSNGVWWEGGSRFGARDVIAENNGLRGFYAERVSRGALRDVVVRGSAIAGIHVESCVACDVRIDGALVEDNLQGIVAVDTTSVVIRGSVVRDNGAGIVLRTGPSVRGVQRGRQVVFPQRGAHVYGNVVLDNLNRSRPGGLPSDLPVGTGIWVDGGLFDVIENNLVDGHSYGIVVTGAAYEHRILGNLIDRSAEADLAWDGFGAQVCASGNADPDGDPMVTTPPELQTVYSCSMPVTVGVPMPQVRARLFAWGMGVPFSP